MTENKTGVVVSGIGRALADNATVVAHGTSRVNFAVQHMLAAARFSRAVGELEDEHKGKEFAEFWESILHNAVACVLTTVASLEAYAHELFFDHPTPFPKLQWERFRWKPTLDKFDSLRKLKLDRKVGPVEDIGKLVVLRAALTHFKPEWENEAVTHKKLSEMLRDKIEGSPFLPEIELLFPRRWASHSCTTWAVSSAIAFAKKFEELSGLPAKYNYDTAALRP